MQRYEVRAGLHLKAPEQRIFVCPLSEHSIGGVISHPSLGRIIGYWASFPDGPSSERTDGIAATLPRHC